MLTTPLTTADQRLLDSMTRLVPVGNCLDSVLWLEVCVVSWPLPHTPRGDWTLVESFPAYATAAQIEQARRALLDDSRYFGRCDCCGQRRVRGHMHGPTMCQGCAERERGVVY